MRLTLLIGILGIANLAEARTVHFKKKVDPAALQHELRGAGITVYYISCSRDDCKIVMPDSEKKNPLPIVEKYVYVDAFDARRKKLDSMRDLLHKWRVGSISDSEKDQLLLNLTETILDQMR